MTKARRYGLEHEPRRGDDLGSDSIAGQRRDGRRRRASEIIHVRASAASVETRGG